MIASNRRLSHEWTGNLSGHSRIDHKHRVEEVGLFMQVREPLFENPERLGDRRRRSPRVFLNALLLWLHLIGTVGFASEADLKGVSIDVPQLAEVRVVDEQSASSDDRVVEADLFLSVLVDSSLAPSPDQLVVRIRPLGFSSLITSHSLRTETYSEYVSPIEVSQTDESFRNATAKVQSLPGQVAIAGFSGSWGEHNAAVSKYLRKPPVGIASASGTVDCGRGVFYKFVRTSQTPIEGQRRLCVAMRVPPNWRGDLLEVTVLASARPVGVMASVASLAGNDFHLRRTRSTKFMVAVYDRADARVRELSRILADSETSMRLELSTATRKSFRSGHRWEEFFRGMNDEVVIWGVSSGWERILDLALSGRLNPYVDPEFKSLPTDAQAACLQYLDSRKQYMMYAMRRSN